MEALMTLVAVAIVTGYQPVAKQTDNSPTWTSVGDRTTKYGVAVSQDMLKDGRVKYGDILYIEGFGARVVNDCMNARHTNRVDLLVFTHKEEKRIGVRNNVKVWRVDYEPKEQTSKATKTRTH